MSKFRIVNLIDRVFITAGVFLICFAWVNFYVRNLVSTFFISLVATGAICFVLFYFSHKKQARIENSKQTKEANEKTFLAFRLLNKKEQTDIIRSAFEIESENGCFFVKGENLYFVLTESEILTQNVFINLIAQARNLNFSSLHIVCGETENFNQNLLIDKKIDIINKQKLAQIFADKQIKINCDGLNLNDAKFSFKEFAKNVFKPAKAKSYFLCGLVLLFSSLILPFNFYYIIFGSMLMLFSLLCKILPIFNTD